MVTEVGMETEVEMEMGVQTDVHAIRLKDLMPKDAFRGVFGTHQMESGIAYMRSRIVVRMAGSKPEELGR